MKKILLYLTISLVTSTIAAAGTGVYRTAITLKNGTQEIYPDTIVKRFDYVKTAGNEGYAINVVKTDGTIARTIATDSIVEMTYGEMSRYEQWAGDWYLVASPNGEANEVGIMIATTVSIPYHAVLPAPGTPDYGKYIYCHIDSMPHRKSLKYDANFKLHYSDQGTIAMVLDDTTPLTTTQYTGGPETYAYFDKTHTYYFGISSKHEGGDTGGRHTYFVTRDLSDYSLVGMELPTTWTEAALDNIDSEFTFNRNYQIHWIVALDIPYSYAEHDEIGIIDIFASPRLMRKPWTKPLVEE